MKLSLLALAAAIMCLLTNCQPTQEEITPNALTKQTDKLVVAGFISPQDTTVIIKVNSSRSIIDSYNTGLITNATVTLSTSNTSVKLAFDANKQYYWIDATKFPIKNGVTYILSVQTPDGLQVTSTCTVPKPVQLQTVQLDSLIEAGQPKQYIVRYYWQDPASELSYYQTTGVFSFINQNATGTARQKAVRVPVLYGLSGKTSAFMSTEDTISPSFESVSGLLSDPSLQMANATITFNSYYRQASVTASLLTVDENYYRYHKAVELATSSDANPFAEPVTIPTNITGGLGCFAAYNRSVSTVMLKK